MVRLFLPCLRLSLLILFAGAIHASAQVVISTNGGTTPNPDAVLLLEGNGKQGLIIPVGDRTSIPSVKGMIIYDTNANQIYYNDGAWKPLGGGSNLISISGNSITIGSGSTASSVNLAQGFSNSANGFLFWNGAGWEQARFTLPTTTQALVYNPATSSWGFQSISGGGGGISTINKGGAGNFISITNPTGPITTINADAIVDGDIAGTANISGTKLQDGTLAVSKLSTGTAINGQFLRYNSGSWAPFTLSISSSVTNVTATAPLTSSGGTTPNISLSGTLPVANGGTGRTTWDGILWGNGAGSITDIGNGINGQVFTMQGTSPGWSPAPSSFTTTNVLPKGSAGGLVASQIFDDGTNVGIGTTTPSNKLHVAGILQTDGQILSGVTSLTNSWYRAALFQPNTGEGSAITLLTTDAGGTAGDGAQISLSPGANPNIEIANREAGGINFYTNEYLQKMTISTAGNVGIGTTTPTYILDVNKTLASATDAHIRVVNPSSAASVKSGIRLENGAGWAVHLQTSNGDNWLELTNNAGQSIYNWDFSNYYPVFNATASLGRAANRWVNIFLTNNPNVSSDMRLKKDISNLSYGLEEVLKMRPVSYRLKSDKEEKIKLGLIAQEVKALIPEIVTEDDSKEKFLGMSYSELIPVLIKAIQEQQKTIDELKSKLTEVKKSSTDELEQLKAEVAQIKKVLSLEAKKSN